MEKVLVISETQFIVTIIILGIIALTAGILIGYIIGTTPTGKDDEDDDEVSYENNNHLYRVK